MFCNHCGKEMPDGAAFCNECGKRLEDISPREEGMQESTPQAELAAEPCTTSSPGTATAAEHPAAASAVKEAASSIRQSDFLKKVSGFIDAIGSGKLCCQLSAAFLAFLLATRLLGCPFMTILVTAANAFLIYHSYKKEKQFNWKMAAWSGAAFLIGILI